MDGQSSLGTTASDPHHGAAEFGSAAITPTAKTENRKNSNSQILIGNTP
jgi:hypothetical protein